MTGASLPLKVFVAYQFRRSKMSQVEREYALSGAIRAVNESLVDKGIKLAVTWQPLDLDSLDRVGAQVLEGIETSAIFLADITELNPNVIFELGFAVGRRRLAQNFVIHLVAHESLDLRSLPADLLGGFVARYGDEDFKFVVARLLQASVERIAGTLDELNGQAQWRNFWCVAEAHEVDIISSEIPEDRRPDFAHRDHPNYLRYAKFADLDSLVLLHEILAANFPRLRVKDYGASESIAQHAHGILIGGAAWNCRVRQLQQFLPIEFEDRPAEECDPLIVKVDGRRRIYKTVTMSNGIPVSDYFLIVRLCPDGKSRLLMFGGGTTHGVLGGIKTVAHFAPGPRNTRHLHQVTQGANEVIVIGRIDHRDGYLNVPDFTRRPPCLVLRRDDPSLEFSIAFEGSNCDLHQ